jgi:MFS-type transporter involved in bile tolerance (Atg22 family)
MVSVAISVSGPFALVLAALGAVWIYQDATKREMETADMWAVGFFVGFFLPPLIGAVAVFVYYIQKREPRYPNPQSVSGH